MEFKIYGIYNCDKIAKMKELFEKYEIPYEYLDYKKYKPDIDKIKQWADFLGDLPINKRGTIYKQNKRTFEKLDEAGQIDFIINNRSCIMRPIVECGDEVLSVNARPERAMIAVLEKAGLDVI
jgi:arsenate reductase (glutaredoxin)